MSNDAADGDDAQKDPELEAGLTVGEYRIEKKVGEGGFGSVYRAVHPLIGKAAAVKVLNRQWSANPGMVQRFISEARAVNQIRHRNIIDIFSFGQLDDGRQYYVMELLEGKGFEQYLAERGWLPPEEAIPILRQVARALDAAHSAGIAHRDSKPDNIFLMTDGDGGVFPKLLDFGIAKLLHDSGSQHKTQTGTPMGTPHYMSPEQCRGKDVDHRTDIYAFGVMVHRTLTGSLPFDGDDVLTILVKHTTMPAPPVSSVKPSLPAALDRPVLHMLEKEPENRPATMLEAIDELSIAAGFPVVGSSLRGALSAPGSGQPQGATARTVADVTTLPQGGTKRSPAALAVGGLAVVTAIAAVAVFGLRAGATKPPEVPAASRPSSEPVAAGAAPPAASSAPTVTLSEDVELTIQAVPANADVFLGTQKLGTAPGPFKVKRGTEKLKITVKATGHKSFDVDVTPSANLVVPVTLSRQQGARPNVPGALENPFQ